MLEAYRVGVSLTLESNVAAAVGAASEQLKALDRILKSTQATANELVGSMRAIGRVGGVAATEWSRAASSMERAARAATTAAGAMRGNTAAGFGAGGFADNGAPRASRTAPGGAPAALLNYYGPRNGALVPYAEPRGGLPVPYLSPDRGFDLQGSPYTPYGEYPPGRPDRGPGRALAPYLPPAGFSMEGAPQAVPGAGFRLRGDASFGAMTPYTGGPPPRGPGGGPRLLTGPEGPPEADVRFMSGERYTLDLSRRRHRGHDGMRTATELAIPAYLGGEFLKGIFGAGFAKTAIESNLRQQGFNGQQVKAAESAAIATQQTGAVGSSEIGNLALIAKIMASVQSPGAAIGLMPKFARLGAILDAQGHGEEGAALWPAIRAAEYTGVLGEYDKTKGKYVVSQKQLSDFLHKMTAAVVVSHGSIGPDQWLSFLRGGGISAAMLRDDDLFGQQMAIIQSLGGARAGRGLQGFGMQFSAGKMSKAAVHLLTDVGVITDPSKVLDAGYGQYILKPGAMPLGELQRGREHPIDFIINYLLPHEKDYLKRHYGAHYTEAPRKQRVEMEAALTQQITSRIPGGVYASEVVRNQALIERDVKAYHGALHRDAYKILLDTNQQARVKAFEAAWQGFEIALSDAAMQPAIAMLKDLTAGLNDLATWAKAHPEGAKIALEGMAVGVTALGVAATGVFTAGIIGRIAAGITAIGGAAAGAAGGISTLAGIVAKLAGAAGWAGPAAAAALVMKPTTLGDSTMKPLVGKSFHERFPNLVTGYDPGVHPMAHVTLPTERDPIPVHVTNQVDSRITNPRDLATGVTAHISHQSRVPPSGYSGLDIRSDPYAAGLQAGVP